MGVRYGNNIPIDVKMLTPETRKYTQGFACGNPVIDQYFIETAPTDQAAVTYLFIDSENNLLISCITLACSAIFTANCDEQFSTVLSAMEILYFAVDERYKHIPYIKGSSLTLSHYILIYMLDQMQEISHTHIGASKVVLYSVPDAVRFYKRCNFKEFGDTMYGDKGTFVSDCVPMYYDLN